MNENTLLKNSIWSASSTKDKILRVLLILLVMFIPLIEVVILTAIRGQNVFQAIPLWNDETWWYAQYAAMSEYGKPLGYFGYAGTHAYRGTFGPWGMYPLLLTGFFARIFGWGLHAFVYYNFFFLALSSLIFILLTKPTNRSLILLAAANALMYITLCYSVICMNEVVRYCMAIVLSGIMYRLIMEPKVSRVRTILRWTLVPLLLMYASCFYIILSIFIPIYLFIMLRNLRVVWRTLITAPVSVFAILKLRDMNSYTCCPYIADQGAISFSPPTLKLKILNYYYSIVGNGENIDLFHLLTGSESSLSTPVLLWFCVLLYLTMGLLIWRLHITAKDPEKKNLFAVNLMSLTLLLAFWGGHVVLYNTTDWTFIRGCNTALCCAIFLSAVMPRGESHVWRGALIVNLVGIFTFLSIFASMFTTSGRFSTEAQDARWAAERQALEDVLLLDEKAEDPWSNTVTLCGIETELYYCLPYGLGLNGAIDDIINENARYVIIGTNYGDLANREEDLQMLQENGHKIIYETASYAVLENIGRTYN